MVRLENDAGEAVWLSPAHVVAIEEALSEGWSRVQMQGDAYRVKGTPDEVHAKLFPEMPLDVEFNQDDDREHAAEVVLEWVAEHRGEPIEEWHANLALQALARDEERTDLKKG